MSLDVAILGFLAEKPSTGYELKTRCFTGPVSTFWSADQAQIYRTLERLKREGRVTAVRKRTAGRPDRKVFELTPTGTELLGALLAEVPPPPFKDPFLLQLYFGDRLSDEEIGALFESRREAHQSLLDSLEHHSDELAESDISPRRAVLRQTALDGAIARERTLIEWLDACIEAVRSHALPSGGDQNRGQGHLYGG